MMLLDRLGWFAHQRELVDPGNRGTARGCGRPTASSMRSLPSRVTILVADAGFHPAAPLPP